MFLSQSINISFTFPNVFPRVCIHRGSAVLGYVGFAENQARFSDFGEARQVSVRVLNHADLFDYKTLLLKLSLDV